MKINNSIKAATLIGLFSQLFFTSVIADYSDVAINHILRINGPIFLRTSEEFAPNKMQYLAADINGNAYDIEGHPVNVTFTGIENFHGEFLPPKTIFLESEHQFVGHATLSINAGRITIRISENEKSYRMRGHDAIIKDTFIVNNSIYELSIVFSQELRKDVLFKNDPDKARATTYFITIDEIKWVAYKPEYNEKLKILETELQATQFALAKELAIPRQPKTKLEELIHKYKKYL